MFLKILPLLVVISTCWIVEGSITNRKEKPMVSSYLYTTMSSYKLRIIFHPSLENIYLSFCFLCKVQDDDMTIGVYYESLCPDCQNFVTKQLYPASKKLGKYFKAALKPFGKAEVLILLDDSFCILSFVYYLSFNAYHFIVFLRKNI